MIKKLLKASISFFLIYFLIAFIYIIYVQASKLKSYEKGNDKLNKSQIEISYNESSMNLEDIKDAKLDTFVECYQSEIAKENFFENMEEKYQEIEELFKKSNSKASFTYEDLYSGLHISYNEKQTYFCASVIKSPVITYAYKLYLEGKIKLDEIMTYQVNDYCGGSGSIQFQPVGSQYSIKKLIQGSIIESDNIAYQMISRRLFGTDIRNYWKNLGATTFWNGGLWGDVNSHDGAIYMKELYKLTTENPSIKEELLDIHFKSVMKLITLDNPNIKIAHKSGWNSAIIHDLAIIYHEQPYVLAITTSKGYDNYSEFFKQATKLINEFHELYWEQKSNYCYNKIFSD